MPMFNVKNETKISFQHKSHSATRQRRMKGLLPPLVAIVVHASRCSGQLHHRAVIIAISSAEIFNCDDLWAGNRLPWMARHGCISYPAIEIQAGILTVGSEQHVCGQTGINSSFRWVLLLFKTSEDLWLSSWTCK